MSYIRDALYGKQRNSEIASFLREEGFEIGSGPQGENGMIYTAHAKHTYVVWFTVTENEIHLYAEYDCGGHVGDMKYSFEEEDMENFKEAYRNAIDWASSYIS